MKGSIVKMTTSAVFFNRSSDEFNCMIGARQRAVKFMRRHQWEKLRKLLIAFEDSQDATASSSGSGSGSCGAANVPQADSSVDQDLKDLDDKGRTILHVLVACNPPLDLVKRVNSLFPSMMATLDSDLATPLHTAVAKEAPLNVVKYLLEKRPAAASQRDRDGKTPLILACEGMGPLVAIAAGYDDGARREDNWHVQQAEELVRKLAFASPRSVVVEDEDGLTAVEHLITSEAPKRTIRVLQHIAVKVMRKLEVRDKEDKRRSDNVGRTEDGKLQRKMSLVVAPGA